MSATHPPSVITLARQTLVHECQLTQNDSILVAVSGGPDSMALMHVLAHLRPKFGWQLFAHGVDHGLRKESLSELDVARAFAKRLDVPWSQNTVDLKHGGNMQARARAVRYQALREAQMNVRATVIATAHHADDRAETVLMRLLRGTDPLGLGVLKARDGDLIRPFIRARKAEIEAHVARHRFAVAVDPSNQDPKYLRTRVRHELIPLMSELNARVVEHLCHLADALAAEDSAQNKKDLRYDFVPLRAREASIKRRPFRKDNDIAGSSALAGTREKTQVKRDRSTPSD